MDCVNVCACACVPASVCVRACVCVGVWTRKHCLDCSVNTLSMIFIHTHLCASNILLAILLRQYQIKCVLL